MKSLCRRERAAEHAGRTFANASFSAAASQLPARFDDLLPSAARGADLKSRTGGSIEGPGNLLSMDSVDTTAQVTKADLKRYKSEGFVFVAAVQMASSGFVEPVAIPDSPARWAWAGGLAWLRQQLRHAPAGQPPASIA